MITFIGKKNQIIRIFTEENGGRGIGRIGPTRFAMELYEPGDDRGGVHAWWTYARSRSIGLKASWIF